MSYVDIKLEEETKKKILGYLKDLFQPGDGKRSEIRLKKGINETTKAIERTPKPLLVVIAEDIQPPELAMHLPKIAKSKVLLFCS